MKKILLALLLVVGLSAMAQQNIQLRSADRAECVKSDMRSLKASFSFSSIEAQDYESERGTFSWLSLPNTVIGGNEGDPQIPVVNELIAVPFGANPYVEITSFSTTDYRLEDYGVHTLVPRQPSLRKDQRPEDVPFVYNASAYQTRGLRSVPQAVVSVEGTMRGIQLGKLTIEPVSYDPVNNILRVFNDIEVTVHFNGADAQATEDMLFKTYSPYFTGVYNQMFNGRAVRDAYSQHPDLYTTPVKMLVITTSTYANNATFQDWVTWKKQKGIYVDVYTTAQTGTTASAIQSFITTQYNQNHPTFLVIVGDSGDVTQSATGSESQKYTDLYYSSIDGDIFPEMYTCRMPVSSSNELTYMLTKTLQYEQYTMPDPSYLNETLLIAGWDSSWTPKVGKPTIQYANTYYYNSDHGITADVFLTTASGQTTCYNYINQVGFVNYTAHGSQTGWADPSFSVSNVNSMTNTNKYFWAMGNCCLAADWGYSGTCFAEAMVRAQNKGAWGYIGSCPSTYWWEDYYFGVGATTVSNQMPTMEQTTLGVYDAMFDDDAFNTLNAVPFFGNVAVTYAHAGSYSSSVSDTYYWEAYHTLGDGSVMPYHKNPSTNNVSHASTLGIGMDTFTVNADPGSYVSITNNNEILGVAVVSSTGTVNVPITPVTTPCDVMIVVTRNQRQPYIQTIQAVSLDGPFISVDGYTPTAAHVGDNTNLSITFKNVGTAATSGNTTVTLTPVDSNVTVASGTQTFGALAANATTTVSGFQFNINSGVADGTSVMLHYTAVNGSDTYEGNIVITANEAVLEYQTLVWDGSFVAGETLTLTAKFKNTGHYQATNAVAQMSTTSSNYISISNPTINVGTIVADQEVSCQFNVTIAANCPETAQIPVTFTLTADGGLTAQGSATLKNSCNVVFSLSDSYGDGWNGSTLTVSFDDGTSSQVITLASGSSDTQTLEIGNGVHVTLTWTSGSQWDYECSFTVSYEDGLVIYQSNGTPSAGVIHEFDCNCAAASQTFIVTAISGNTEQGTVSGGGEFSYGETCIVTATPTEGYSFMNWTVNDQVVSTSSTYSFTVTGDVDLVANFVGRLTVSASANPEEGGTVTVANGGKRAQYVYDFEDGTSQGWTTLKGPGGDSPNNWMHVVEYTQRPTYATGHGHSSDGFMLSESYISGEDEGTGTAVTPDNYLVSPQVQLGGSVSFWVTGGNDSYCAEHFAVLVSTSGNTNISDFTQLQEWTLDANAKKTGGTRSFQDNVWYEYTVDLSEYSGMGYVAFHHFNCYDQWILCLDDVTITDETPGGDSPEPDPAATSATFDYGESCIVTATPNEGYYFMNWTENGSVVSSSSSYTFTVTSDRSLVANFAEGNMIGDGSEGTSVYLPSYNYWKYTLSQQIYTAEEFGEAGIITSIAFFNGGEEKTRTYDFYMKATEKSAFANGTDWEVVTEADKVFSGSVTMVAGDWTFVTFDTPFIFDGTSNVVLVADDNTGEYTSSPHMACRVFGATSQAIYVYSDNTDYNPFAPTGINGTVVNEKNQLRFTKEAFSDCMRPTQLTATEVGPDFVRLSWTENGASEEWIVAYGGYYVEADTNEDFLLEGLDPETQYTIQVRPVCDENLFSSPIIVTTLEACPMPQEVEVGNITGTTATVTWVGYNESYLVQLGHTGLVLSESFGNGIPSTWDNSSDYPWIIVDGYMQSGNAGVASSESAISVTVTFVTDGTVEFDAECLGEGTSTYWDHCDFFIDDTRELYIGAGVSGWNHYSFEVTAGEHTFTWSYTKDSSVNPSGDHFAVDNITMGTNEFTWDDPVAVEGAQYIFRGLTPETTYCVRVLGVCGEDATEWSAPVLFTTTELTTVPQTITLSEGTNWFSSSVEITMADLQAALLAAYPNVGMNDLVIKSKSDGQTAYNPTAQRWVGSLTTLDLSQMYMVKVPADGEISVEGMPIDPADHPATIAPGVNWIAFPLSESMSITEAFAGFPTNGDIVKAKSGGQAQWNSGAGRWIGALSNTPLEPGQGYIYNSKATGNKTFTFPVSAK